VARFGGGPARAGELADAVYALSKAGKDWHEFLGFDASVARIDGREHKRREGLSMVGQ
jgi:hypothetical protein